MRDQDVKIGDTLYRLEDDNSCGSVYDYRIDEYTVVGETECFWLIKKHRFSLKPKKFGKLATNPYAHKNKEDAAYSYLIRKWHHQGHAMRSLKKATALHDMILKEYEFKKHVDWEGGVRYSRKIK